MEFKFGGERRFGIWGEENFGCPEGVCVCLGAGRGGAGHGDVFSWDLGKYLNAGLLVIWE